LLIRYSIFDRCSSSLASFRFSIPAYPAFTALFQQMPEIQRRCRVWRSPSVKSIPMNCLGGRSRFSACLLQTAAAYPLTLPVFHVREGLLLFYAESISCFTDSISVVLDTPRE
jgi:hypothetical protein